MNFVIYYNTDSTLRDVINDSRLIWSNKSTFENFFFYLNIYRFARMYIFIYILLGRAWAWNSAASRAANIYMRIEKFYNLACGAALPFLPVSGGAAPCPLTSEPCPVNALNYFLHVCSRIARGQAICTDITIPLSISSYMQDLPSCISLPLALRTYWHPFPSHRYSPSHIPSRSHSRIIHIFSFSFS